MVTDDQFRNYTISIMATAPIPDPQVQLNPSPDQDYAATISIAYYQAVSKATLQ